MQRWRENDIVRCWHEVTLYCGQDEAMYLKGQPYCQVLQQARPRPWERCRLVKRCETLGGLCDCSHGVWGCVGATAAAC